MSNPTQYTEPEQGLMRGRNGKVVDKTRAYDSADTPFELTYGHAAVHRDIIVNATNVQAAGSGDLLYFFKTPADPLKQVHLEYLATAGGGLRGQVVQGTCRCNSRNLNHKDQTF